MKIFKKLFVSILTFLLPLSIIVILLENSLCSTELSVGDYWETMRKRMVYDQIVSRGVTDEKVIKAMLKIPRHLFVPQNVRDMAYVDSPLPIGEGQTISQPYIVAYMTEVLKLNGDERVLEIGTGSGYQAAVLSLLCKEVYSIEIIPTLAERAKKTLKELGYKNVTVIIGDGYKGLPSKAPFDAIIVTAAPPTVPNALKEQLKIGGRMVLPVGETNQDLVLIKRKSSKEYTSESLLPVIFVPMVKGN